MEHHPDIWQWKRSQTNQVANEQSHSPSLFLSFSVSRLLSSAQLFSFSCLEWQLKCGLASRPGCNRAWPSDCLKRLQRTHVTPLSPAEEQEVSEGGARRLLDDLALPPYHDLLQQQRVISQGQAKKLTLQLFTCFSNYFPSLFCSGLSLSLSAQSRAATSARLGSLIVVASFHESFCIQMSNNLASTNSFLLLHKLAA